MENQKLIYALLDDGKVVNYKMKELVDAQTGIFDKIKEKAESQGQSIIVTDFENPLVRKFCEIELRRQMEVNTGTDIKYFILESKEVNLFENGKWDKFTTTIHVAFDGIKPYNSLAEAETRANRDINKEDGYKREKPDIIGVQRGLFAYACNLPVFSAVEGKVIEQGFTF